MSDQTPEPPPEQPTDESNYYRPQYTPPQTDTMGRIIPTSNPKALAGYYVGCGSVIPCVGLVFGPIAFVLGLGGLKAVREHPEMPGKAHAWIAVVAGAIGFLYNFAWMAVLFFAWLSQRS